MIARPPVPGQREALAARARGGRVDPLMSRLKPLFFVLGLSLVSAVSLRLLLGHMAAGMNPAPVVQVPVDSAEMARRMVGCGHLRFVFDSLGYRSGQWPEEVDPELAAARADAVFHASESTLTAIIDGARGRVVGEYLVRGDTAYLTLGDVPGGLRSRLAPVGDSLGGLLERAAPGGTGPVIGRLFLSTPVPPPPGCAAE